MLHCKMKSKKNSRVVIIGAGISGLVAATTLHKNGFSNVNILEARNRLGGRIHSISTENFTFEAGAQWIQEGLENIFENLSNGNAKCSAYSQKLACFHEEQKLHKDDIEAVEDVYDKFLEILDGANDDCSNSIKYGDLLTLMAAKWDEHCEKDKNLPPEILKEIFQNLCICFRTNDGSNSFADANPCSAYEKVGDERVLMENSLSFLIGFLANSIPSEWIKLNHKMKRLLWNENSNNIQNESVKIVVSDGNGNEYDLVADHVIITVPLGYLKKYHQDIFCPSLPKDKINAINRIGFGNTNKIILFYKKPFWNKSATELLFVWKNQEEQDRPWWKSVVLAHILEDFKNEKFYIVIFVSGEDSPKLEEVDNETVGRTCAEIFQKFIGLDKTPYPDFTFVSKWCSDPLTFGSYSFSKLGCSDDDRSVLARPLPDKESISPYRLLFAGEATHELYYATIHGGYFSGKREAERLVEYYL